MISWDWYVDLLPTATLLAAVVMSLWLIRRVRPPGLVAAITGVGGFASQLLSGLVSWHGNVATRIRDHRAHHADRLFGRARHPLATAFLHVGLATAWVMAMSLLVLRNRTVVLAGYRRGVASGALAERPGEELAKLAEVFGPVLATAVVGIVVLELTGVTEHLPFIQGVNGRRRGALLAICAVLLVPSVLSQLSLALQDDGSARSDLFATIERQHRDTVAPLPGLPTAEEIAQHQAAEEAFHRTTVVPATQEFDAGRGAAGWRTMLAIVAIIIDFLLGWSVVPALLTLWLGLTLGFEAIVRLTRSLFAGLEFAVRVAAGALLGVFGFAEIQRADGATMTPSQSRSTAAQTSRPVVAPPPWADRSDRGANHDRPATTADGPATLPASHRWNPFSARRGAFTGGDPEEPTEPPASADSEPANSPD